MGYEHSPFLKEAKEIIYSTDLTPVVNRLIKIDGWPQRHVTAALEQYRNFLYLKKKYGEHYILPPSIDIDEVWHAHILHTEDYIEFCSKVFGYFLHHHPHHGKNGGLSDEEVEQLFEKTQELYCQEFGDYIYCIRPISFKQKLNRFFNYACLSVKTRFLNTSNLFFFPKH